MLVGKAFLLMMAMKARCTGHPSDLNPEIPSDARKNVKLSVDEMPHALVIL